MSNPFKILADYPENGPEPPKNEQKVHREKNKHESGTGRRDKEKRQGRGQSNWGNALDEANRPPLPDTDGTENQEAPQNEDNTPKINYVPASNFFDSDDDEPEPIPQQPKKRVVNVPEQYAALIASKAEKQQIEIRKYDDEDESNFELGFINSKQAISERPVVERRGRGRGGPRGGRGGQRGGHRGGQSGERHEGRGGRGGPRDGARGGRGHQQYEHYQHIAEKQAEGEEQQRDNKPGSGPRDRRPGNVQHQRVNQGNRNQNKNQRRNNLDLSNFPKL